MVPHYKTVPTKPTPAMRRFLAKLARGRGGRRSHGEMGFPAYPMRVAMEQAGWLTVVWSKDSRDIWGPKPSQLWASPTGYKITPAGRKAIGEVAHIKVGKLSISRDGGKTWEPVGPVRNFSLTRSNP